MVVEYKVDIAGTEYEMSDIFSATITQPLFEKLSVGNACSAELKIQFIPKGTIPRMARITPYVRKTSADNWTQLGVFYTDTRSLSGGLMGITAYDSMLRAEQIWEPNQSLEFPMTMQDAVTETARLVGVSVDPRTVLNSAYTVDYPANDYTIRDVWRYIAAAHGGNWIITAEGNLLLVPLFGATKTHDVGSRVSNLECYSPVGPITGVTIVVDEKHEFTSGSDSGYIMEVECPYGTQSMSTDLLGKLAGKTYYGYHADDAELDSFAELGDGISVGDITSILAYRSVTFGPGHMSEISAPGENDIEHEYPYVSREQKRIERKISASTSEIQKTLDSITLKVVGEDGSVSEVKLTDKGQIDLTGYATFRGLSDGTTVIDGGCIRADSKIVSPIIIGSKIYAENPDSGTSKDYAAMEADGFAIRTPSGDALLKLGTSGFPFLQLGWGTGEYGTKGLLKKFFNGLWIGNSVVENDTGNFVPRDGCNGIFVDIDTSMVYVVHDTSMQNVYTGDAVARFG